MKFFKSIVSIFVVMALMGVTLICASAATIVADKTSFDISEGEEIAVKVTAKDIKGTEAGDLLLYYDTNALEFVKEEAGEADMTQGGKTSTPGEISCSFLYSEKCDTDNLVICTLRFKALKAGESELKTEVISWDGAETPTVEFSKITVEFPEPTTKKPEEKPTEPESKLPDEPETLPTEPASVIVEEDSSEVPTTNAGKTSLPKTGETSLALICGIGLTLAGTIGCVAISKKKEDQ